MSGEFVIEKNGVSKTVAEGICPVSKKNCVETSLVKKKLGLLTTSLHNYLQVVHKGKRVNKQKIHCLLARIRSFVDVVNINSKTAKILLTAELLVAEDKHKDILTEILSLNREIQVNNQVDLDYTNGYFSRRAILLSQLSGNESFIRLSPWVA